MNAYQVSQFGRFPNPLLILEHVHLGMSGAKIALSRTEGFCMCMYARLDQMSNNLQDACGWFLHCVVQLIFRANQIYTDPETDLAHHPCFRRLSAFLSDTTKHHAGADIAIDFDLTKDAEYSHLSVEGEANLAKVEHLKNVYQLPSLAKLAKLGAQTV